MAVRKGKLTLEVYTDFFQSDKQSILTVDQLNQILSMHGFKKLSKAPKKIILEAMRDIELLNPSRSTLNDNDAASSAFLTLEEIIADLNELNWQECCVSSIQTVNSFPLANYTDFSNKEKVTANSEFMKSCFHGDFSSSSCVPDTDQRVKKLKPKRRKVGAYDDRSSDYAYTSPLAMASWDSVVEH